MSVTLLPRIDGPIARPHRPRTRLTGATAVLVNRLARPRAPFAGTVEGLSLRVSVARVVFGDAPEVPDAVVITLLIDEDGMLDLRLPAAILDRLARAVQDDLSVLPPPPAGPLLVELALDPLLDAVERITGRSLRIESVGPASPQAAAPQSGTMTLLLDAEIQGERFPAQIDLGPPPALAVPPRLDALLKLVETLPARTASVSALPIPVAFLAGSTRLTVGHLKRLRVGDAILPDLWHPARREVMVSLGGQAASATTDRHKTTLKSPFRPTGEAPAASGNRGMAQDTAAEKAATDHSDDRLDEAGLDAVTVTLAFELGRRSLGVGELKGIGPGHVFDLGLDPEQPVDLVVNGARIGRGEIVEIGERIGVRVVRLFGQD